MLPIICLGVDCCDSGKLDEAWFIQSWKVAAVMLWLYHMRGDIQTWPKSCEYALAHDFDKCWLIFGRPFVKRFVLCYQTILLCDVGVLWPNNWRNQDITGCGGRPRPRLHCVRWGPISPKRCTAPPQFSARLLWTNGWMDQNTTWYGSRPRLTQHCVKWGPSFLLPHPTESGTASRHYLAHVCYGQRSPILSYCWAFVRILVCLSSKKWPWLSDHFHITAPLFKYLAPFWLITDRWPSFLCKHV